MSSTMRRKIFKTKEKNHPWMNVPWMDAPAPERKGLHCYRGGAGGGEEEAVEAKTMRVVRRSGVVEGDDRGAAAAGAILVIRTSCARYTMTRKTICTGSGTRSCTTTTTTTAKVLKRSTGVTRPPLTAFKLWCLKKCSRSTAWTSSPPLHGCEVAVATGTNEAAQTPAWMRDGNLDATIWKNLPDDILEYILRFLPFPNLFRCATVCKQWRTICHSPHLRLSRPLTNPATPWPAYCPVRYSQSDSGALHWSAFSIATNTWQEMPRIALTPAPGKSILTGAGGLLVIYRPGAIVVINPVSGERRKLPPTVQKWSRPDVLHMIAEPQGSYKIILAGTEAYSARKPQPTEVYDSVTQRWTVTGSLLADLYLDLQDGALDSNGLLVCTAQKVAPEVAGDTLAGTDALVAYDVRRGVWSEVAADLPDESARQTPLATAGRTLVAVAPVDDDGPVGSLYALNSVSRRWELLASMPEPLHRRVRSWGACVVSGHHVVVVSDTAEGCVVSYDLTQRTWSERSPIKFSKSTRLSNKDVRLPAPISFRPDVHASP